MFEPSEIRNAVDNGSDRHSAMERVVAPLKASDQILQMGIFSWYQTQISSPQFGDKATEVANGEDDAFEDG